MLRCLRHSGVIRLRVAFAYIARRPLFFFLEKSSHSSDPTALPTFSKPSTGLRENPDYFSAPILREYSIYVPILVEIA